MSIKIMSSIWDDGPTDKTELLVLLALADHARDDGECWPSIQTIAQKSRISDRSARRVLRQLESGGWITTEIGVGPYGCNVYCIYPGQNAPGQNVRPPDNTIHPPGQNNAPPPDIAVSAEPSIKPSVEPYKQYTSPTATNCRFGEFWGAYPKAGKKSRKTCLEKWKKKKLDAIADVLINNVIIRQAQDRQWLSGYIPNALTYLNQERWEDETEIADPSQRLPGESPVEHVRRLSRLREQREAIITGQTGQLCITGGAQ